MAGWTDRSMLRRLTFPAAAALLLLTTMAVLAVAPPAAAVSPKCQWSGANHATDTNWSDSANWTSVGGGCTGTGSIPGANDTLDFPASPSSLTSVDNISGLTGLIITIEGASSDTYTISASAATIGLATGTAISDSSSATVTISAPIDIDTVSTATAAPTIADSGSGNLKLTGLVSSSFTPNSALTLSATSTGEIELLGNTNTYTGGTVVSQGSIATDTSDGLGASSGNVTVDHGATISLAGSGITMQNFLNLGDGTTGTAAIWSLGSSNTWQGWMNIAATTTDDFASNSVADALIVDGHIGGSGVLTASAGAVALDSGVAGYGGDVVDNGATMIVETGASLGTTQLVTVDDGGTLQVGPGLGLGLTNPVVLGNGTGGTATLSDLSTSGADSLTTDTVTLTTGSTGDISATGGAALDLDATIAGGGNLVLGGSINLNQSSVTNTYTGTTTVASGTTEVYATGSFSSAALTIDSGATMLLDTAYTLSSPLTLGNGGGGTAQLEANPGYNEVLNGNVTLAASSTGWLWNQSTTNNRFTVDGTVSGGGTLKVGSTNASYAGQQVVLTNAGSYSGGTIVVGAGPSVSNGLTAQTSTSLGTGPITLDDEVSLFFQVTSGSPFTMSNALTVNGAAGETAQMFNDGSVPFTFSGATTVNTNAFLSVGHNSLTVSGPISGGGHVIVTMNAGQTLTLAAADTTTGAGSALGGGTLDLTSAGSFPAASTPGGSVIEGSGSTGALNQVGGTIQGGTGAGSPGILTTSGGLILSSTATFAAALDGSALGTGYSQVVSSGAVQLLSGPALSVSVGSIVGGDTFDILKNTSGSAITGTFNGLAEGTLFTAGSNPTWTFQITYVGGTSGHDVVLTALAPDGSGAMAASPATVSASSSGQSFTFTYTAASGGTSNGVVRMTVPSGWTAPTTSAGHPGYTFAAGGSGGTTTGVSGQVITVSGVTLNGGQTLVIFYGSGTGGGVTVPSSSGAATFTTLEQSSSGSTLSAIASQPTVTVEAADATGTLSVSPSTVPVAESGQTLTFTYTAANGGLSGGSLELTVPPNWGGPTASPGTAGYVTASGGTGPDTVSVSGQEVTISGVTLASGGTLTIVYGSGGGASGLVIPDEFGTSVIFSMAERSSGTGTFGPLTTNPAVRIGPGAGRGYWEVASDGGIFTYGDGAFHGSTGAMTLNRAIVGMAATPDGRGYWLVATDGGIFAFGDAPFYGSTGSMTLNEPVVGMAATPDGKGYWLVASDGGIFAFGDAGFFGSTGSITLNKPIVGMAATPDGNGYWLVASDGGIFAYGDAPFYGSTGSIQLNQPVVGMAATPDGLGYWFVAADGGIFAYGDAPFYGSTGSMTLNKPVVGMAPTPDGKGYWFVASDGGIFAYGDAGFYGSTGSIALNEPVVGMASTPS